MSKDSNVLSAPARLAALRRTALMDSPAEESFDRLARLASKVLGAPVALVALVDAERQFLKSCVGLGEPWSRSRVTPLSHSLCKHEVQTGEPLLIEDARLHPATRDAPGVLEMGVVAYAGIPLVTADGHTLGSLCVIDHSPRRWTADEVAILRDLAAAVMTEITLRQEAGERERRDQAIRLLADAGAVLSSSLDYRATLRTVAHLAVPGFATGCVVDLVEGERIERVEVALAAEDAQRQRARALRFQPDWSSPHPSVRAIRTGEPVLVSAVTDAWLHTHTVSQDHLQLLQEMRFHSIVCVPLVAHGRTLGALTFGRTVPTPPYVSDDLALAAELGRRAGLAIDNARVHRRARRAVWTRDSILRIMSQDLRTPAADVTARIAALLDTSPHLWQDDQRGELDAIHHAASRIGRRVEDLIDFSSISSGGLRVRPEPAAAAEMLQEAVERIRALAPDGSLRVLLQPPVELPSVRADRRHTVQLLCILMEDAVDHSASGVTLTLSAETLGEEVRFCVSNPARSLSADEVATLFDLTAERSAEALGDVGFSVARAIVDAHGGRIWAESTEREGSRYFFTLPVAGARAEPTAQPAPLVDVHVAAVLPRRRGDDSESQAAQELAQRSARFLADVSAGREGASVADHLRKRLTNALHHGHLCAGDRLPSIRELCRALGDPHQAVVGAYRTLGAEGWVDLRSRSGAYVAGQNRLESALTAEAPLWLAGVLTEAWDHGIRIPRVPEIVQRWTAGIKLRCACLESNTDDLVALTGELTEHFGLDARPVHLDRVTRRGAAAPLDAEEYPAELRAADLLVTTAFHAPIARDVAQALGKPLAVASLNTEVIHEVEARLRVGPLTVICADPRFGERMTELGGGRYRDRIRLVLVSDRAMLEQLDPADPVLLTRAAHQEIGNVNLRRLVPPSRLFSRSFARTIIETTIRLNIEAERR
jgi:GAF domain-containing protein/DNA-binding transcriptional regulator YhcF (GntR family)